MPKLMIIEDEPHIVASLTFLFGKEGFEVIAHGDAESALESLKQDTPDVMILDVMLPGANGFEVLRKIRAMPATAALPVLMLTAKGQRRDREVAESAGADKFMTKPFSNMELVEAVKALAQ